MCRFDPKDEKDVDDLELLEANLKRLCDVVLNSATENEKNHIADEASKDDEIVASLDKFGGNPRYGSLEKQHPQTLRWIARYGGDCGPGFVDWFRNDEPLSVLDWRKARGREVNSGEIYSRLRFAAEIYQRSRKV